MPVNARLDDKDYDVIGYTYDKITDEYIVDYKKLGKDGQERVSKKVFDRWFYFKEPKYKRKF